MKQNSDSLYPQIHNLLNLWQAFKKASAGRLIYKNPVPCPFKGLGPAIIILSAVPQVPIMRACIYLKTA